MSFQKTSGLILGSAISVLMVLACNRTDDTELTARTQSRVNESMNATSEVEVSANDDVVTLTGLTSSDVMHARAVAAARSVPGVRDVVDHISTPGTLTGATVPK